MTGPAPTDPAFAAILDHSRGKAVLADGDIHAVRRMMRERAATRPGPAVDRIEDRSVPGPGGPIPVRIYAPEDAVGTVLAYHGGGWMAGDLDSFDPVCRHLANEAGVAVVSVDYRLAPEHPFPAAVEDAWAALCHVAEHAAAMGLPGGPVVVFGESAGANLAAVVSLLARDAGGPSILRQILAYPSVDARARTASMDIYAENHLQTRRDVEHALRTYALDHGVSPEDWRLSPFLAPSHAGVAPAFILSAECDAIRDDSAAYAHRLMAEGVPVVHVRYAGMIHTFLQMRNTVDAAEVAQRQVADETRRSFTQARG